MSTGRNGKASHQVGPFTKTQELSKTLCFPWRDLVLMGGEISVSKDELIARLSMVIKELAYLDKDNFESQSKNKSMKFRSFDFVNANTGNPSGKIDITIEWS